MAVTGATQLSTSHQQSCGSASRPSPLRVVLEFCLGNSLKPSPNGPKTHTRDRMITKGSMGSCCGCLDCQVPCQLLALSFRLQAPLTANVPLLELLHPGYHTIVQDGVSVCKVNEWHGKDSIKLQCRSLYDPPALQHAMPLERRPRGWQLGERQRGKLELDGTGNKNATNGASGITTRSKDATRGSWPYY